MVRGNNLAEGTFIMPLAPVLDLSHFDPAYFTADLEKAESWSFDEKGADSGWKKNDKGVILLLEHLVEPIMKYLLEATHYARDSLTTCIK